MYFKTFLNTPANSLLPALSMHRPHITAHELLCKLGLKCVYLRYRRGVFLCQLVVGDCNTCREAALLPQAGEMALHCPGCLWLQRTEITSQMKLLRQAEQMVSFQLRAPLAKVCDLHKTCPAAQLLHTLCWAAEELIIAL